MKNIHFLALVIPLWGNAQVHSLDPDTTNSTLENSTSRIDWYEWNANEAVLDPDYINDWEQKMEDLRDQIHPAMTFENITAEQLQSLGIFSEFEVFNILQYRNQVKTLMTYYELLSIRGISMDYVNLLKSVLPLKMPKLHSESKPGKRYKPPLRWSISSNFSSTFERPVGYLPKTLDSESGKMEASGKSGNAENSQNSKNLRNAEISPHFLGSPLRCTMRLKLMRPSRWTLSAILDKDPGETFGNFKGGYLHLQPKKGIDEFILGNFQWSVGQGLTLWSGAALRAAPDPRNSVRFARGIRPYGGASEQRYLRGVAVSKKLGSKWNTSVAYNQRWVDNPNPLSNSGIYNTESAMAKRRLYSWEFIGLEVRTSLKKWILGGVYYTSRVMEDSTNAVITSETRMGIHYLHQHKSMTLAGEITRSPQGWATAHGLTLVTGGPIDLGLNFRFFSPEFQPSIDAPIARKGKYGERGITSVWAWRTKWGWNLNGSVEFYGLYTSSYQMDLPHWNRRWFARITGPAYEWGQVQTAWGLNNSGEEEVVDHLPLQTRKKTQTIQWKYTLPIYDPWQVSLQSRWSNSERLWGQGHALSIKRTGPHFTLQMRYLFYNTPTFATRIYLHEAAPRFQWSMPAFAGLGHRWYANANWRIGTEVLQLRLGARVGRWINWDGAHHGSNWNEIPSPAKTDWSVYVSLQP